MAENEVIDVTASGEAMSEQIDLLWNYDDPAGSEQSFQQALLAAGANREEFRAQALTQIARCLILQRKMDQGHATLDQVAQILSERTPIAEIRYWLERGRGWNDAGRVEEATAAFIEAFHRAQASNSALLAIDAAHMLGVIPPYNAAIVWNQRAIALAQGSTDSRARRWLGTLFMNMGVGHQHLGQYDRAQEAFESSLEAFIEVGNHQRVRLAKLCLAKNLRLSGELDQALSTCRALLAEIQSYNEPVGYAFEEIAECLLAMGRMKEAAPMFAQGHAVLSVYAWFPPNENHRLLRMKRLSEI
jgi:tetratricopeptide (TPR) repeat protein